MCTCSLSTNRRHFQFITCAAGIYSQEKCECDDSVWENEANWYGSQFHLAKLMCCKRIWKQVCTRQLGWRNFFYIIWKCLLSTGNCRIDNAVSPIQIQYILYVISQQLQMIFLLEISFYVQSQRHTNFICRIALASLQIEKLFHSPRLDQFMKKMPYF